jgi:phage terminase large subunit-like protein
MPELSRRELLEEQVLVTEALLAKRLGRQIDHFYATPEDRESYATHLDIFRAGRDFRERAAFGGNRTGKSTLGSFEMAMHLSGQYEPWWPGFRFDRPITAWACGTTLDAVRDINQEKLLGPPTALGTGMIPREAIVEKRRKSGVPDLYDTVTVRHVSGGLSTVQFKPYAAGREAFQGRKIQFCWLDEECDWPVYEEILLRTTSTGPNDPAGKIIVTMTPLKGLSVVASHFLEDGALMESDDRYAHLIGWDDVPHLSDDEKRQLLTSIPRHQQEARTQGYPSLGVGAIYQYSESSLLCEPRTIPMYHYRCYGLDVGWNCTAAVFISIDPDTGEHIVFDEYKKGEETATVHAAAIKLKADTGNGISCGAIDPAARGRSQLDGNNLLDQYRNAGLKIYPAENAVEAGIHRIQQLIDTDRLKIYPKCTGLLAELRQYHRDDRGKVIKRNDHLLDALRYAVATEKIHLRPRPADYKRRRQKRFAWTS